MTRYIVPVVITAIGTILGLISYDKIRDVK